MKKQILIISPFFYPELISTGKYNSFLAKSLVKKGFDVDVICFHPLYPDWRPCPSDKGLPGVRIFRGGARIRFPKASLWRRIMLEGGFMLHLLQHSGRIKRHSHIVAVFPPMLFLPLIRMIAGPNARITAIVHDLQGIMAGVGLAKYRSLIIDLIRLLEKAVLRRCHQVIALSNAMANFLLVTYNIPSSKIAVCWPFVTLGNCPSGSQLGQLFARNKKHVVYAGALGEKQNPDGLISFFNDLLNRRKDIVCHIFSSGPIYDTYRLHSKRNNRRLVFHPLVTEQDLPELYNHSHIQVIPEKIGFSQGAVPSKLANIMAAGVPILYIGEKNSDVRQIIQGIDAGLCVDSWNIDKLYAVTDRLLMENDVQSRNDRRRVFNKKYAAIFNVETLVKELFR